MSFTETELKELMTLRLRITDNTLDDNNLATHCVLDNGRHAPNPNYGVGQLDELPTEILIAVLRNLDLQSLTEFRRVNQRAMALVDSLREYRVIIKHAPNAVRGMLCLNSARFNSIVDLYLQLCTAACDSCGNFGGYLYLITCRRVCFLCVSVEQSYLPLLKCDVLRKYGLGSRYLDQIPSIRSLPGCYSPNSKTCRKATTLYDHDSARQLGISVYGTEHAMNNLVSQKSQKKLRDYKDRHQNYIRKSRPPRVEDVWDARSGNPYRFMAIVSAPHFDKGTGNATNGFHCLGCQRENVGPDLHWRKRYSIETFKDHVMQWGDIVDGCHRHSGNARRIVT